MKVFSCVGLWIHYARNSNVIPHSSPACFASSTTRQQLFQSRFSSVLCFHQLPPRYSAGTAPLSPELLGRPVHRSTSKSTLLHGLHSTNLEHLNAFQDSSLCVLEALKRSSGNTTSAVLTITKFCAVLHAYLGHLSPILRGTFRQLAKPSSLT